MAFLNKSKNEKRDTIAQRASLPNNSITFFNIFNDKIDSMTKCPFCDMKIELADFFVQVEEQGFLGLTTNYKFKGNEIQFHGRGNKVCRFWACPHCDTLLGITETAWAKKM